MTEEVGPELAKAAKEDFEPGKLKAGEELPPALRQAMMDIMVPAIVRGAWEGIYALPDEAREAVFKAASRRCHEKIVEFAGFNPKELNDVDEFIAAWDKAFGGTMRGKREGDRVYWEFTATEHGGCPCPMVRLGLIEPNPKLCLCSCHVVGQRFEEVVKRPVVVELLDSPLATGANKCEFLIHLKPTLETAKVKG